MRKSRRIGLRSFGGRKMECNDKKCPVHGGLKVRGNVFTGKVVSAKPQRTVVIKRTLVRYIPKYERYKKEMSKIYAHNPECINAEEGDRVTVGETRRLSKTKSFVVTSIEKKAEKKTEVRKEKFEGKKAEKVKEKEIVKKEEAKETNAEKKKEAVKKNKKSKGKKVEKK